MPSTDLTGHHLGDDMQGRVAYINPLSRQRYKVDSLFNGI